MAKVVWSAHATFQIISIAEYISRDSVTSALRVTKQVRNAVRRLKRLPQSGRLVPEDESRTHREVVVPPYRVMYTVVDDECRIMAVLDSRRDILNLAKELRLFE